MHRDTTLRCHPPRPLRNDVFLTLVLSYVYLRTECLPVTVGFGRSEEHSAWQRVSSPEYSVGHMVSQPSSSRSRSFTPAAALCEAEPCRQLTSHTRRFAASLCVCAPSHSVNAVISLQTWI